MILIIACLIAGIICGHLIKSKKILKITDKIYVLSVYSLLFLMGIGIGHNEEIFSNIGTIGLVSLALAVVSIFGSIIVLKIVNKLVIRVKE